MTTTTEDHLVVDVDRRVATVTIDRPDRRNAINGLMIERMGEILRGLAERDDIDVVVLTGSGAIFSVGGDAKTVALGEPDHAPSVAAFQAPLTLREMPQLTIAALNGSAAGAALGWACGCDVRIASSQARFATAFLDRGLTGDMMLPYFLPRVVGSAQARRLSFLGEIIDTAEAHRIGLVTEVVPQERFRERMAEHVDRLRELRPVALRGLKQNYLSAETTDPASFAAVETERVRATWDASGFADFLAARAGKERG
jgi:2-(1,2-epoxy-1,2-dihydrophenyl)acetyl-CoA isomerase